MDTPFEENELKAVHDLLKKLLAPGVNERPPNAASCWELLAKVVPSSIPFRAYYACALTSDGSKRDFFAKAGQIVRAAGEALRYSVYIPGEHTSPVTAPSVTPTEVYWIDRERVASSDLVIIMADHPSFGVGQEAEIAANAGVPIVLCHSRGAKPSRMLMGIPGHIMATLEFNSLEEFGTVIDRFFRQNRERLSVNRRKREREYHLRVGNRIRHLRERLHLTVDALAELAELNVEQVRSVESRPEQQSNFSLVILRRVARALNVPPAELVRDQSSKDESFAILCRSSVENLRVFVKKANLSYETYERLKTTGRERLKTEFNDVAARFGEPEPTPWNEERWRTYYVDGLSQKDTRSDSTQTLSLFPDDSAS